MAAFEPAFENVLQWEGGFQKNSSDRGNWTSGIVGVGELKGTNMGISAMSFPTEDIEHLSKDRASYLYRLDWWKFGDIENQEIATKVFNLSVNWQRYGGHGPAIHVLQEAIKQLGGEVDDDGNLGPKTIRATNELLPIPLLSAIRSQAMLRYKAIELAHPEEKAFFKDWEKRALS